MASSNERFTQDSLQLRRQAVIAALDELEECLEAVCKAKVLEILESDSLILGIISALRKSAPRTCDLLDDSGLVVDASYIREQVDSLDSYLNRIDVVCALAQSTEEQWDLIKGVFGKDPEDGEVWNDEIWKEIEAIEDKRSARIRCLALKTAAHLCVKSICSRITVAKKSLVAFSSEQSSRLESASRNEFQVNPQPNRSSKLQRALEFVKDRGPIKGLAIAKHLNIEESTFRKHYAPKLRDRGVISTDDGYVYEPSDSQHSAT